jgi:hypothetical protein
MGSAEAVETRCVSSADPVLLKRDPAEGNGRAATLGADTEQNADRLEIQANEFPENSSAAPTSSAEHPATSHPWGRSLHKRDPRSWSRYHQRPEPSVDEGRSREVTADERSGAPFLAALCGYQPDADRLREEGRR